MKREYYQLEDRKRDCKISPFTMFHDRFANLCIELMPLLRKKSSALHSACVKVTNSYRDFPLLYWYPCVRLPYKVITNH